MASQLENEPLLCSPRNISGEPSIAWAQESNRHFIKPLNYGTFDPGNG